MEHKSAKRRPSRSEAAKSGVLRSRPRRKAPLIMSQREFASLGGGEVAYIRPMTTDEAMKLYPSVKDLPRGIAVFALHAADGTPIALTDTRQAAVGHAKGDKLVIASLH